MTWSARRRVQVVVPLVVTHLLLGLVVLDRVDPAQPEAPSTTAPLRARPVPDLAGPVGATGPTSATSLREREAGVRALLAARGAAVRDRDRAAFLATVDPEQPAFRARQAVLFDALAEVPLHGWEYVLDPSRERPRDPAVDARRGKGWWAPQISLRYRLAGFDDRPTVEDQWLTLVPRGGRWLVAADDDFAASGARTARGLWDAGPVVAVTRPGVLVLGHPGDRRLLRSLARTVQDAVPRVSRVWGQDWSQRVVVLVPSGPQELQDVVGGQGDLSRIAAVAVAAVDGTPGALPVGDRIVVNPATFLRLGPTGRRVVLTHEVAHVATRAATGAAAPAWLVEGLADHLGYAGSGVPLAVAARELRAAVQAGELPDALPSDDAFDGSAPGLEQAYEQAWLAVTLLVERHGEERVVEFYRAVGRASGQPEVEQAWREHLGTTEAAFTRVWRAAMARRLR